MSVEITVVLPDDLAQKFQERAEAEDRTVELQLLRLVKEYAGRDIFRAARTVPRTATILPVAET
jgi:predicted transcriptional regulator